MCREALDDCRRYRRDKEANSQRYKKLTRDGLVTIPSSDIKVGDLIQVEKVITIIRSNILVLYFFIIQLNNTGMLFYTHQMNQIKTLTKYLNT